MYTLELIVVLEYNVYQASLFLKSKPVNQYSLQKSVFIDSKCI